MQLFECVCFVCVWLWLCSIYLIFVFLLLLQVVIINIAVCFLLQCSELFNRRRWPPLAHKLCRLLSHQPVAHAALSILFSWFACSLWPNSLIGFSFFFVCVGVNGRVCECREGEGGYYFKLLISFFIAIASRHIPFLSLAVEMFELLRPVICHHYVWFKDVFPLVVHTCFIAFASLTHLNIRTALHTHVHKWNVAKTRPWMLKRWSLGQVCLKGIFAFILCFFGLFVWVW